MFFLLIWIKPWRGFKAMGWMGLKWVLNVQLNEEVLHHLETNGSSGGNCSGARKAVFWTKPDPPYFLTKTHNDPNLGGILGEFG